MPIRPEETFWLEQLGDYLRTCREDAGLTRSELAAAAQLSPGHLGQLEWGVRRTRRSTLTRIALALQGSDVDPDALESWVDLLCDLAGPALAAESTYKERVDQRRERRAKKAAKAKDKRDDSVVAEAVPMARNFAASALAEYRATGKWPRWVER